MSTDPLPLVLASASPRRRELLAGLGLRFTVDPRHVEDDQPTRFPTQAAIAEWVEALAVAKAAATAVHYPPEHLAIGADTIVVLGHEVLHKPADEDEAVAMLRRLQGRTHVVMTGVAVRRGGPDGTGVSAVARTAVTFRACTDAELQAYVAAGESLDKAGAYAAQGRGALIIERLDGCYFNVVGLPLAVTARLLAAMGYDIWAAGEAGSVA